MYSAAQNLTGWHRGQLAVPNAWAKHLIEESCKRDQADALDMWGVLYKGAMALAPQAVGGATQYLGGTPETAASLSSMTTMLASLTMNLSAEE